MGAHASNEIAVQSTSDFISRGTKRSGRLMIVSTAITGLGIVNVTLGLTVFNLGDADFSASAIVGLAFAGEAGEGVWSTARGLIAGISATGVALSCVSMGDAGEGAKGSACS